MYIGYIRPGRPGSEGCAFGAISSLAVLSSCVDQSSVILIDSSTGSPVHVFMLSIQAVRGLPRLRAHGAVQCERRFLLFVCLCNTAYSKEFFGVHNFKSSCMM